VTIPPQCVSAIEALGYTPDEARFLYVVATHSGYFLPRQLLSFAGCKWGIRPRKLTHKLESRGHATWRQYEGVGVYHLCSNTLYRRIDRETLRNHRRHSTEFVRTRLLLLDFVLANQDCNYFETEDQKLRYFCGEMGIPKDLLPAKAYRQTFHPVPSLRYFVDRFPLFLGPSASSEAPTITFTYVDAAKPTLAGFSHHLESYASLFRRLRSFRFVYVSDSSVHFVRAGDRFASIVSAIARDDFHAPILRYFRVRKHWEARQYGALTNSDLEALNDGHRRFQDDHFADLYRRWSEGKLLDGGLCRELDSFCPRPNAQFGTWLVQLFADNTQNLPAPSEAGSTA
jgi:hypothetical protein